ncbi:MAG: RNA polymerase sigma factor, partial [Gemmatimonadales bacterium]
TDHRAAAGCHTEGPAGTLSHNMTGAAMSRVELEQELSRLHAAAFGWALLCCEGHRARAEDALQASYLKILDGRARFAGRSSFRTWLFGVVRRTAAEEGRRGGWRRWWPLSSAGDRADSGGSDPVDRLVGCEETRRLEAALADLPRRQREVLHLVFYQDLTIAAAAELLGIGVGTGRTHYERGKAALRNKLEGNR